jgi:hypothetical protein
MDCAFYQPCRLLACLSAGGDQAGRAAGFLTSGALVDAMTVTHSLSVLDIKSASLDVLSMLLRLLSRHCQLLM